MFTEYPKALNYFRQAIHTPDKDLKDIMHNFLNIRKIPDEVGAARYLIGAYYSYQALISGASANASIK